jgi:hypothetical protein
MFSKKKKGEKKAQIRTSVRAGILSSERAPHRYEYKTANFRQQHSDRK